MVGVGLGRVPLLRGSTDLVRGPGTVYRKAGGPPLECFRGDQWDLAKRSSGQTSTLRKGTWADRAGRLVPGHGADSFRDPGGRSQGAMALLPAVGVSIHSGTYTMT
ncbi:hypothetical protein ROHU_015949 [Labeo rohita]|uniref:Uncharacterized protein n=1 Tax=Labeo rohita TaxID=84645 RepID=A0A498NME1_LABRO|nr:hypothetical protein ROHU_015949 [Labeo rohita]